MTTHTAATTRRPKGHPPLTGRQRFTNFSYKVSPVPLHLAVLHPLRDRRPVPADLHGLRLAARSGTSIGGRRRLRRLRQLRLRAPGQRQFWIAAAQHAVDLPALSSVPQIIFALLIAAVLDANLRAKTFWRMGVLLPYVVHAGRRGPHLQPAVRRPVRRSSTTSSGSSASSRSRWHVDPLASHVAIATMVNFRWTGYNALILLAGMQAIPRDLLRAGGASTAPAASASSSRSRSRHPPHPHLRDHHLDHRRPADLRRAAPVRPVRTRRQRLSSG